MPWTKIIGMRDVLVHVYFEIDAEIVWLAATQDLPPLKAAVEHVLAKFGGSGEG